MRLHLLPSLRAAEIGADAAADVAEIAEVAVVTAAETVADEAAMAIAAETAVVTVAAGVATEAEIAAATRIAAHAKIDLERTAVPERIEPLETKLLAKIGRS